MDLGLLRVMQREREREKSSHQDKRALIAAVPPRSHSPQSFLVSFFWWFVIVLNLLFAYLMRNVEDAFNLKDNWKKILYWFGLGTPLNMMATVAVGLNGSVRQNAYAMGQIAYVCASLSYLWFGCIVPIRTSFEKEAEEKALAAETSNAVTASKKGKAVSEVMDLSK